MTKKEFNKGGFKKVSRKNEDNENVYSVLGVNNEEGLVLLDCEMAFNGECWVRYENVEIIEKI
jgi:hypothetical protein